MYRDLAQKKAISLELQKVFVHTQTLFTFINVGLIIGIQLNVGGNLENTFRQLLSDEDMVAYFFIKKYFCSQCNSSEHPRPISWRFM
jgi:hypothetical protein